jgi:hypothetical protein
MTHLYASRAAPRGTLAAAGALAALVLLAGCFGGGGNRGSGKLSVNIAPIVQQLGGGGDGQTAARTGMVAGPPPSAAVTPVQTLVVGAIVIDFQNTPIGPNTSITDALKTSLKNAAINSVQFLQLVSLPTSSSTVDFDAPPPGSTHWQIVVVGLRDSPSSFDQIGDNSPIYYGFNTDMAGNPVFLTSDTVGDAPLDITMRRACLVAMPPAGCAQYGADSLRTPVVTSAVEIVGVYIGTALAPIGPSTLNSLATLSDPGAASALNLIDVSAATSVQVDTTHKTSAAYSGTCTPAKGTAGPGSNGSKLGTDITNSCTVESYITTY